ncbi:uncharacterized protein LOC119459514 isoform X2 [Dermacentor silvarum]|uniref:uncharacterized protein LOC119459514 isoform X2 n=1 Tax=Dermacentor silvarum TaxID=543639 RepID=UPI002100A3B1|nr:uncharacterized protein LOC119459514 isoform X2 [Dermacentor silvarum]
MPTRTMPTNSYLSLVLLLGFLTTIVSWDKGQKGRLPSCPPPKCQHPAQPNGCCFIRQNKCVCHCVKSASHCTFESTKLCRNEGIPACTKELGKTVCHCVNRAQHKPELPPKNPGSPGRSSCELTKCYNHALPLNCCLMSKGQCYCRCVAANTQCKSEWASTCGARATPACTVQAGRTLCKCIPGHPLPALVPSTGSGKPGGAGGGILPSSCRLTPCPAVSSKSCCLVKDQKCQCACVKIQTSCSVTWIGICKPPFVVKCEKAERVCHCVSSRIVGQLEGLSVGKEQRRSASSP